MIVSTKRLFRFVIAFAIFTVSSVAFTAISKNVVAQGNTTVYFPVVMKDFQGPPAPTYSYYVQNPSALADLGVEVGQLVITQAVTTHVIILDFGDPGISNNSYGFRMVGGGFIEVASASAAVQQFALSWIQTTLNTPHTLTIAMGGNNHGGTMTPGHGTAWGGAIAYARISVTDSRVKFVGGIDAEQEWGTAATTRAWAEAFRDGFNNCTADAGTGACLYNFGNSNCGFSATNQYCGFTDWYKNDIWYLSGGLQKSGQNNPFAAAFPLIYNTVGSQGRQWASVSLFGATTPPKYKLYFVGSVAQKAACQQFLDIYGYYPTTCIGADNTPEQAFSNLRDSLNADNRTSQIPIPWSTDIKYQVSP